MARCHRTDKHARIEARRLKRGLGTAPVDWSGLIDHNHDNSADGGYDSHEDIEDYARWAEASARKAKSIGC
jgi:hypothetical protein